MSSRPAVDSADESADEAARLATTVATCLGLGIRARLTQQEVEALASKMVPTDPKAVRAAGGACLIDQKTQELLGLTPEEASDLLSHPVDRSAT